MASKIYFPAQFHALSKTEKSRRVTESHPVCVRMNFGCTKKAKRFSLVFEFTIAAFREGCILVFVLLSLTSRRTTKHLRIKLQLQM
jgi:hypothetical protein